MNQDIRWVQRFDDYSKALLQMKSAIDLSKERPLTELEVQGLIQSFEYTHELAWKTLRDFLKDRGNKDIYGSKDATREAFRYELIENGEVWMDMIKSRNQTSHTYNQKTAELIVDAIIDSNYYEFEKLHRKLISLIK